MQRRRSQRRDECGARRLALSLSGSCKLGCSYLSTVVRTVQCSTPSASPHMPTPEHKREPSQYLSRRTHADYRCTVLCWCVVPRSNGFFRDVEDRRPHANSHRFIYCCRRRRRRRRRCCCCCHRPRAHDDGWGFETTPVADRTATSAASAAGGGIIDEPRRRRPTTATTTTNTTTTPTSGQPLAHLLRGFRVRRTTWWWCWWRWRWRGGAQKGPSPFSTSPPTTTAAEQHRHC